MLEELDWVRWQLDRIAAARLGARLDPALEKEYDRLCHRERELILTRDVDVDSGLTDWDPQRSR